MTTSSKTLGEPPIAGSNRPVGNTKELTSPVLSASLISVKFMVVVLKNLLVGHCSTDCVCRATSVQSR